MAIGGFKGGGFYLDHTMVRDEKKGLNLVLKLN